VSKLTSDFGQEITSSFCGRQAIVRLRQGSVTHQHEVQSRIASGGPGAPI